MVVLQFYAASELTALAKGRSVHLAIPEDLTLNYARYRLCACGSHVLFT